VETPEQALSAARRLHRSGDLAAAEMIYRQILLTLPSHPDALHFLGIVRYQTGHADEATSLLRQAVAVAPEYADAWNNLGNILKDLGRTEEAADAYREVLDRQPEHPDALNNLGLILKNEARYEEAEKSFRAAIRVERNHAEALENLGNLLRKTGRLDDAAKIYRRWLGREPKNPTARHLLASCCGERDRWPERAAEDYVVETFDRCAETFDESLERLHYRAPELCRDALSRERPEPSKSLALLDAGCGTGLLGPLVEPWASRLVGVDLSAGMLAKAKEREVYDELVQAELTGWLEENGPFEVILCADTLPYFGDLTRLIPETASALAEGGIFVFTVEDAGDLDYRLDPSGRYCHGESYVRRTLETANLSPADVRHEILRMEGGENVNGLVVTALPV
jgi:predicted TPR repeat methyltransferase